MSKQDTEDTLFIHLQLLFGRYKYWLIPRGYRARQVVLIYSSQEYLSELADTQARQPIYIYLYILLSVIEMYEDLPKANNGATMSDIVMIMGIYKV